MNNSRSCDIDKKFEKGDTVNGKLKLKLNDVKLNDVSESKF